MVKKEMPTPIQSIHSDLIPNQYQRWILGKKCKDRLNDIDEEIQVGTFSQNLTTLHESMVNEESPVSPSKQRELASYVINGLTLMYLNSEDGGKNEFGSATVPNSAVYSVLRLLAHHFPDETCNTINPILKTQWPHEKEMGLYSLRLPNNRQTEGRVRMEYEAPYLQDISFRLQPAENGLQVEVEREITEYGADLDEHETADYQIIADSQPIQPAKRIFQAFGKDFDPNEAILAAEPGCFYADEKVLFKIMKKWDAKEESDGRRFSVQELILTLNSQRDRKSKEFVRLLEDFPDSADRLSEKRDAWRKDQTSIFQVFAADAYPAKIYEKTEQDLAMAYDIYRQKKNFANLAPDAVLGLNGAINLKTYKVTFHDANLADIAARYRGGFNRLEKDLLQLAKNGGDKDEISRLSKEAFILVEMSLVSQARKKGIPPSGQYQYLLENCGGLIPLGRGLRADSTQSRIRASILTCADPNSDALTRKNAKYRLIRDSMNHPKIVTQQMADILDIGRGDNYFLKVYFDITSYILSSHGICIHSRKMHEDRTAILRKTKEWEVARRHDLVRSLSIEVINQKDPKAKEAALDKLLEGAFSLMLSQNWRIIYHATELILRRLRTSPEAIMPKIERFCMIFADHPNIGHFKRKINDSMKSANNRRQYSTEKKKPGSAANLPPRENMTKEADDIYRDLPRMAYPNDFDKIDATQRQNVLSAIIDAKLLILAFSDGTIGARIKAYLERLVGHDREILIKRLDLARERYWDQSSFRHIFVKINCEAEKNMRNDCEAEKSLDTPLTRNEIERVGELIASADDIGRVGAISLESKFRNSLGEQKEGYLKALIDYAIFSGPVSTTTKKRHSLNTYLTQNAEYSVRLLRLAQECYKSNIQDRQMFLETYFLLKSQIRTREMQENKDLPTPETIKASLLAMKASLEGKNIKPLGRPIRPASEMPATR